MANRALIISPPTEWSIIPNRQLRRNSVPHKRMWRQGRSKEALKRGGGDGQGCSLAGPGHFESETRRPKAERTPKSELRIRSQPCGVAAHRIKPVSDFGFRTSFAFRVSAFGFQGCGTCSPINPPDLSRLHAVGNGEHARPGRCQPAPSPDGIHACRVTGRWARSGGLKSGWRGRQPQRPGRARSPLTA